MKKVFYSVVIPVYNEEATIIPLHSILVDTLKRLHKPWEIIFVNDGSTDRSEAILRQIQRQHAGVSVINLVRNFGQTAAFAAGIDHCRGHTVITLDSDLQNDPRDIPSMISRMTEENADVICGWRRRRHDPMTRTLISNLANWIIHVMLNSPIHDLGCSLRVYKQHIVKNIELYGEMHRFIPILARKAGAKIIEMPVRHHPRTSGVSKYGLARTFKVLLDMVTVKYLTSYETKPIYMFGFVGMTLVVLSLLAALWVIIRRILLHGEWVSPMLFIMTTLFNSGIICILLGLLAEIQMRAWFGGTKRKNYIIRR